MLQILEIITNTTSVKADVSESVVAFGAVACIPGLFFWEARETNHSRAECCLSNFLVLHW